MIEVVAAREVRSRAVRDVLVEAFDQDPGFVGVVPDLDQRRRVLSALFGGSLVGWRDHARVAVQGGRPVGAAVWPPPGTYPADARRMARMAPSLLAATLRVGRAMRDVAAFGAAVDAAFPDEPVRYLQLLGVAPSVQGRGVGSTLLRDGLATADAVGQPVYLETSEQGNVGYYQRFGFTVMEDSPAPIGAGLPTMWRMLRPPI